MSDRIGFIGAGKVGTSLGAHFGRHGLSVSGFYSRSDDSARKSAEFTNSKAYDSVQKLLLESDIIAITVPDSAIQTVWEEVKQFPVSHKIVFHCSGSLSSFLLDTSTCPGCETISIHPLLALHDKFTAYKNLESAFFTIEGHPHASEKMKALLEGLGNKTAILPAEHKTTYHASAVFLTNLVVGLTHHGVNLLKACDLPDDFADEAWKQLFAMNAQNIVKVGPINALTGPVERNDGQTVTAHLNALDASSREIYKLLSEELISIARKKHPESDYSPLSKELSS